MAELAHEHAGAVARGIVEVAIPLPATQDIHRLQAAVRFVTLVENRLQLVQRPTGIHVRRHPSTSSTTSRVIVRPGGQPSTTNCGRRVVAPQNPMDLFGWLR